MSDFLTNLVIRSFSRTPSFQPVMMTAAEPSYVEPEVTPQPMSEPPVQNTNRINENDRVEVSQPTLRQAVPTNPKTFESPEHEFTEKSVVPPPAETPKPEVHLTAPEITSTETQPVQTNVIVNPPAQFVRPSQTSIPRRRPTTTKVRKAEPTVVEQVIDQVTEQATEQATEHVTEHVTGHVTGHVTEPVAPHVTQHVTEHVTEQVIERPAVMRTLAIENKQEITNSFTTLVPKPTTQPLPSVNPRPKPPTVKGPIESEPAALPPETVINVAIGRIEVRANPAAAPRRERQSPGPKVMTLDDYVQQRSRGAK